MEEKIEILKKDYDELVRKADLLDCLEACGVDNWDSYPDALEMHLEVEG